jgi:hypothetical protein
LSGGGEEVNYNISYIYPMDSLITIRSVVIDDAQEDPNAAMHVQINVTNAKAFLP